MNIFKETNDFIGSVDLEQENSLSSLFRLAKQIRMKLGNQGYLLDHYLSLFFDAVYNLPPLEAMDDGYQAAAPYYDTSLITAVSPLSPRPYIPLQRRPSPDIRQPKMYRA